MKKIVVLFLLVIVVTGCQTVYSPVVHNVDISKTDFSDIDNFKEGRACAYSILGFGPFGETRITQAIKKGGIKKVKAVEYEYASYPFYSKRCICVYGK